MTSSELGRIRRVLAMGALLFTTTATLPARAESDEQKAMALFEKGRRLARDQRCAEAIAPFLESIRYVEGVGPLLNLGNCYETLGKTASAHKYFRQAERVAREKEDKRREEAAQRARAVEKDLSTLTIRVPPMLRANAEVRVDGESWSKDKWNTPVDIDPGMHDIELLAPPQPKQTERIEVRPKGDHVEWNAPVALSAPKAATEDVPPPKKESDASESPGSTQRTIGYVAAGVGGVSILVGSIFGIVAINRHAEVTGRCPTYPRCSIEDKAFLDDANASSKQAGAISLVGFIAGVALLATGIALVKTTAPAKTTAAAR